MATPINWRPSDRTRKMLTELMDHYNIDTPGALGMAVASLYRTMQQERNQTMKQAFRIETQTTEDEEDVFAVYFGTQLFATFDTEEDARAYIVNEAGGDLEDHVIGFHRGVSGPRDPRPA